MAGLVSLKTELNPEGRKTDRKVSKRLKRKQVLGPTGIGRTEFKPKFWKRY